MKAARISACTTTLASNALQTVMAGVLWRGWFSASLASVGHTLKRISQSLSKLSGALRRSMARRRTSALPAGGWLGV
jgi:hypothetical protein